MDESRVTPRPRASVTLIRRIRNADQAALAGFYAALSPESRRLRFFSAGSGLGARTARSFCHPDHAHQEGFVVVTEAGEGETEPGAAERRIVGHLCLEPTSDGALEMAVAIADAYQRHGLGRRLLRAATTWARQHGYEQMRATILVDNVPMLRLLQSMDGRVELGAPSEGVVSATVDLVPVREAAPA